MDLKEKVKHIVDENHTITDGMCGITIPYIQKKAESTHEELKLILRQLYDEKYIRVREGLNGKLIFKKII